jgi:hypothetical protein
MAMPFRVVHDPRRAALDFEWQKATASRLKMSQEQLNKINHHLGKIFNGK